MLARRLNVVGKIPATIKVNSVESRDLAALIALMEIREIMKTRGRRLKYVLVAASAENLCRSRRSPKLPS